MKNRTASSRSNSGLILARKPRSLPAMRIPTAVRQIVGKRLTWDQLTGKTDEAETRTEAHC